MFIQPLEPNNKLRYYLALDGRKQLNDQQLTDYQKEQSGFQGEYDFEQFIKHYEETVVLSGVYFKKRYVGEAQFDFIVIHRNKITYYEIKNFKGTYEMADKVFIGEVGNHVKHPDVQLESAYKVLDAILKEMRCPYVFEKYIVFIHPTYFFKGDTNKATWLFRSTLKKHLKQYETYNNNIEENIQLAKHLQKLSLSLDHYQPIKTPFTMDMKGTLCPKCRRKIKEKEDRSHSIKCKCGCVSSNQKLIFNNLRDLYTLKEAPFSMIEALEWLQIFNRRIIWRVLDQNFKKIGSNKGTKYYL